MRPYLITAKLMRPSNMKRFPTPGLGNTAKSKPEVHKLWSAVTRSPSPLREVGTRVVYVRDIFILNEISVQGKIQRSFK
jgi:hypothetical protein